MALKKYDNYKDSGIEWIGEIPEQWVQIRLKVVANAIPSNVDKKSKEDEKEVMLCNYVDVYKNDYIENGMSFMKATASDIQIDKLTLQKGDVIITKDSEDPRDIGIPSFVTKDFNNVVCGYHLTLIRSIDEKTEGSFLYWLLRTNNVSQFFYTESRGVTRYALGSYTIKNLSLCLPPLPEQTAIANYLDHKTAQIDDLISKKQRLIALLQEERTAIINQAVTKGIDPNVPMKESGIEWLGEIPAHWEVKPLKYVIKELLSGVSVNSTDSPIVDSDELGILKTSCVYDYSFRPNENKQVIKEEYSRVKCPVTKDSIIVSRMNTPDLVGASGYVAEDYNNLFLPDRLWKTVFHDDVDINVKWLSQILISDLYKKTLSSRATGTSPSMKNISKDDLLTLPISYPPKVEQDNIECFLSNHEKNVNQSVTKISKEINLLKEYKTALISEVVTGKVDVRDELIEN